LRERVKYLCERVLNYKPSLCHERGKLITESYNRTEGIPQALRRAIALKDILEKMSIYIAPGELIVGNQASKPRAAPLFPEFSMSFLEEELEEFPKRPYDSFEVDEEVKKVIKEIAPYWRGKTHEDRVLQLARLILPPEVQKEWEEDKFRLNEVVYAGVRKASGDGHIIPNYARLLRQGFKGVIEEVNRVIASLDYNNDPNAFKKKAFLEAVKISYEAAINFVLRYAKLAKEMALKESDEERKKDLLKVAEVCQKITEGSPRTFYEALQLVYFIHLLLHIESNGHSVSLGRMDQYLYPFYRRDVEEGKLTREDALELIEWFYLKLYELNKVRPWPETRYKSGYPMFMTITLSGQTREGEDATNELSYLFLDALAETKLPQPTVVVRVHSETPDDFMTYASNVLIKHGGGLPAFFSDEVIIPALMNIGVPIEDARDYAIAGCSEAVVPGKSLSFTGGDCYFNLLKILEITLNGGVNPRTGVCLYLAKKPNEHKDIDDVIEEFRKQLSYYVSFIVPLTSITSATDAELNPTPFASGLINYRIEIGKDISEGGGPNTKYSHTIIQGHGIANVANSLYAIDRLVFKERIVDVKTFVEILRKNWKGPEGERLRRLVLSLPKYGNDVNDVDKLAARIARMFAEEVRKYKPWRGGVFGVSLQGLTANVPEGETTGATPDGRLAGEPLADNASTHAGTDMNGPTATLKSVSKIDHTLFVNGNILNLKFHPSALMTPHGEIDELRVKKFAQMVKSFLIDLKGFQVQFNIVSADVLRRAQVEPEKYRNLIVKVAGYSAYFVSLDKSLQDQIIARTEHVLT
jgi:formate C-acetyltransferase